MRSIAEALLIALIVASCATCQVMQTQSNNELTIAKMKLEKDCAK